MLHNKLPMSTSLKKRGWKGSTKCCLCNNQEDVNHIFFGCVLALFVWSALRGIFGWNGFPILVVDLWVSWLLKQFKVSQKLGLFLFAGIAWAIWRTRNTMVIEKKFSHKPAEVLTLAVSFVQKWIILLTNNDRATADKAST